MYFKEFGINWNSLLAASIGISAGSSLSYYTLSMFGPPMLAEFGWSRADYALISSLPLFTMILVPLAGRFTDRFGARISATIGFTAIVAGFLAFTVMSGSLVEFFAIYLLQQTFGILTTMLVFSRVIVERFDAARGLALSVLMTGPPLMGAIFPPIIGEMIQQDGWRGAYLMLAAVSGLGGTIAIAMMGRRKKPAAVKVREDTRLSGRELMELLRNPTFLLIIGGMFLVNLPQSFASSQLKLVMMDNGLADSAATWMVSLYAIGVIVGRFASGLALDRIQPHLVALYILGLPAVGFLILATSVTFFWILAAAVMVIGFAQGAEGDIGAYLVSRKFSIKNYSLLLSCVTATIGVGSAIGAVIMSATLRGGDSYGPFLVIAAVATLLGALLFVLTGRSRARNDAGSATAEVPPAIVQP